MPQRAALARALSASLAPLPVEVVVDDGPGPANPWRGYIRALTDPPQCSHLLVIQDDAQVAAGLPRAVGQIAASNPGAVVCLFVPGSAREAAASMRRAAVARRPYAPLPFRSFLPVVATMWPLEAAADFMAWARLNPTLPGERIEPRSDDAMAGRWARERKARVVMTVPSIVEHPDVVVSTIGKPNRAGADKGRVAVMFTEDASSVRW